MKKIQLSTIEQTAQIQVINVNSYLVAKSVRIMLSMKHAIAGTRTPEITTNEEGKHVPSVTEDGKPVYRYDPYKLNKEGIDVLHNDVLPFLEELCDALEGAE